MWNPLFYYYENSIFYKMLVYLYDIFGWAGYTLSMPFGQIINSDIDTLFINPFNGLTRSYGFDVVIDGILNSIRNSAALSWLADILEGVIETITVGIPSIVAGPILSFFNISLEETPYGIAILLCVMFFTLYVALTYAIINLLKKVSKITK